MDPHAQLPATTPVCRCCGCCCPCRCAGDRTPAWPTPPAAAPSPPAPVVPPLRPLARLIKPIDVFLPGEEARLYWLQVRAPCVVYVAPVGRRGGRVTLEDPLGTSGGRVRVLGPSERYEGAEAIALLEPAECVFLRVRRNVEWLEETSTIELGIRYADVAAAFAESDLIPSARTALQSPLVHFPDGTPAFELPQPSLQVSFPQFIASDYSTLLDGVTAALYELLEEIALVEFPAPPARTAGPVAPAGAQHKDNYCGISAFIHSMQNKFTGALPPNAGTNSTEWDKVGDELDHSNTFGERAGKMVDNVNKNFRDKQGAADGKRYCAQQLDDKSAANLVAESAHCDLKMLIYDLPTFGHWVDVTGVTRTATGVDLTCQDYGSSYTVPYNPDKDTIDFSNAAGSTMGNRGNNFGGKNPTERIYFVAVCECSAPPP